MRQHSSNWQEGTHLFVKDVSLIHLSRESVHQEASSTVSPSMFRIPLAFLQLGRDGVSQQPDGDLTRDDLAFADVLADQISVLRSFSVLLSSQQITRCGACIRCVVVNESTSSPERWANPNSCTSFAHCVPFPRIGIVRRTTCKH